MIRLKQTGLLYLSSESSPHFITYCRMLHIQRWK